MKGTGRHERGIGLLASRSGFSLTELLTVIALMAILAAFSAPSIMEWRRNMTYKQAAFDVANALKTVRSKSVSSNQQHGVRLTPSNRTYQFARYSSTTKQWVYFGDRPALSDQVVLNLNATAASAVAPVPNIRFSINGSTFDNYSVRINDTTPTSATKYTVAVDRSGRIRVLRKN